MKRATICVLLWMAAACGGETPAVDPVIDDFELDPAEQEELEEAASNGEGADGTFSYDESSKVLTIEVSASSFSCGVSDDETLVANVVELTPTTMVWTFVGQDDGTVTWTRVDDGTSGVVGVWETDEPPLYLILSADGSAQIFGADELCGDGGNDDRPRNGNNCVELSQSGEDIVFDGLVDDWSGVGPDATLRDEEGDSEGKAGGDLDRLKVEVFGDNKLYVLAQLFDGPSETFRDEPSPNHGNYRITLMGDGGLSLSERVIFRDGWGVVGDSQGEILAKVGTGAIEFEVDFGAYEAQGLSEIDMIMVESMDCSSGTCETMDGMDCGYLTLP